MFLILLTKLFQNIEQLFYSWQKLKANVQGEKIKIKKLLPNTI